MELTHGSLFDGAGGMRLGFEQANWHTLWVVESDKRFTDNPRRIEDFNRYYTLSRPTLISGGPPCQRTSSAASLSGSCTSASLWPQMLRVVEALKPEWVVVEQPASVLKSWVFGVVQDLQRSGYGVAGRVVDSKHWLPQQRTRWFIIGRLGATGLAVWDHLYADGERRQARNENGRAWRFHHLAGCPDCLPGGVLARVSSRIPALVGAGNAVTVPVAEAIAWMIRDAL